jgi:hypothetical protein
MRRVCATEGRLVLLGAFRLPVAADVLAIAQSPQLRGVTSGSSTLPVTVPNDETLEAQGALIGEIVVRSGDIFDPDKPGEGNVVFRAANKLHINTHERTIRQLVLVKTGDRYSRRALDESERILRSTGYLYDARVRPLAYDGERVSVLVETRDVWTLGFGLGYSRKGGTASSHFGIEDRNFLGTGRDVAVERSQNVDRSQTLFRYRDPNLFGKRGRLQLWLSDLSDGRSSFYALERPFYSLAARWAVGGSGGTDERVESYYSAGVVTSQLRHQTMRAEAYGGFSHGLVNGRARRLLFGFTYEHDQFGIPPESTTPAVLAPPDRTVSYPWIGYEEIEDGYFTAHDVDQIARTEDLNLGPAGSGRASATRPRPSAAEPGHLRGVRGAGDEPGQRADALPEGGVSGRYGSAGVELLAVGERALLRARLRRPQLRRLSGPTWPTISIENQLLLSGDNGIRGYPLRYQDGDRRVRLNRAALLSTVAHPAARPCRRRGVLRRQGPPGGRGTRTQRRRRSSGRGARHPLQLEPLGQGAEWSASIWRSRSAAGRRARSQLLVQAGDQF